MVVVLQFVIRYYIQYLVCFDVRLLANFSYHTSLDWFIPSSLQRGQRGSLIFPYVKLAGGFCLCFFAEKKRLTCRDYLQKVSFGFHLLVDQQV